MASTTLSFDLIAHDRASNTFDRVGRSASSSTEKLKTFAKVGALALAGASVVLVRGLTAAVKAAAEDQAAQEKLANQLKVSAGATDEKVAAVERWIDATARATGVSDDELRPALGRLVTATGDVAEAQDLLRLAQDVSAGSGKSLLSVAEALMKAQNGSVSGLSRLGIATKDAKGETLEFKDVVEKMGDTFQGAAATHAETFEGKMDRLKVAFDEAKESVGARLIPVLTDFADWFLDKGIPMIDGWVDKAEPVIKDMLPGIKDGLSAVRDVAKVTFDKVSAMVQAFGDMPDWAQKAIVTGSLAAFAGGKLGLFGGKGGAAAGLGGLVSRASPMPVFVTNPGFGSGGMPGVGVPGSPGGGPKGGPPVGPGVLPALPALGSWTKDAEDLWEKLPDKLAEVTRAFVDIAQARTGVDGLVDSTKALDGVVSDMTLETPRKGFQYLQSLSEKTGMSMADLRAILPATNKAIEDSGGAARLSAGHTKDWLDVILGTDSAVRDLDGKKPNVPFEFPGLIKGITDTLGLGQKVDETGKKRPKVPFEFPNLIDGIQRVWQLDHALDEATKDRTIDIVTHYSSVYDGQAGGGGHPARDPNLPPPRGKVALPSTLPRHAGVAPRSGSVASEIVAALSGMELRVVGLDAGQRAYLQGASL